MLLLMQSMGYVWDICIQTLLRNTKWSFQIMLNIIRICSTQDIVHFALWNVNCLSSNKTFCRCSRKIYFFLFRLRNFHLNFLEKRLDIKHTWIFSINWIIKWYNISHKFIVSFGLIYRNSHHISSKNNKNLTFLGKNKIVKTT